MRTAIIIVIGFAVLGAFVGTGYLTGGAARMKTAALVFIVLWFVAAAVNMYLGVARAGYGFTEELPVFLLIFIVPAALAFFLQRGSH